MNNFAPSEEVNSVLAIKAIEVWEGATVIQEEIPDYI